MQSFSAKVGERTLIFQAQNSLEAFQRAKRWEESETSPLQKIFLHKGTQKQVIWDQWKDWGVIPKPPRNWKWWWKTFVHHCFYHPLIPLFMMIRILFPSIKIIDKLPRC